MKTSDANSVTITSARRYMTVAEATTVSAKNSTPIQSTSAVRCSNATASKMWMAANAASSRSMAAADRLRNTVARSVSVTAAPVRSSPTMPELSGNRPATAAIATASALTEPMRRTASSGRTSSRRSRTSYVTPSLSRAGPPVSICSNHMPEGLPPYVLVARIASIIGMSFALATGLLFLIGGLIVPSLVALFFFFPSLALMVVVERHTPYEDPH